MFCSECGNDVGNDTGVKFCHDCGAKILYDQKDVINVDSLNRKDDDSVNLISKLEGLVNKTSSIDNFDNDVFKDIYDSEVNKVIPSENKAKVIASFDGLSFELVCFNDRHFIPSYQISSAAIKKSDLKIEPFSTEEFVGDKYSWVAVKAINPNSIGKKNIQITILENEFMKASTEEFEVKTKGEVFILPKIAWKFENLKDNTQLVSFELQIEINLKEFTGDVETRRLQDTCQMVTINFCPFYVKGYDNKLLSIFAAYVNEDHPEPEIVRKEGLQKGYINKYYGGNRFEEIEAIWKALTDRGIKYSNITTSANSQKYKHVFGQFVRLTGDVLKNEQANCADGSVFIASILQKIDFDVSLIIVPGHMFICVDDVIGYGRIYIETTKLGSSVGLLEALIDADSIDQIDAEININSARNEGIIPISA
jgi:hypothetical protein